MKKSWTCPKCLSQRVGYFENMVDKADGSDRKFIGYQKSGAILGLTAYQGCGDVEGFVCTECGYYEEYVKNPQQIQWDTMKGFRWCVRR